MKNKDQKKTRKTNRNLKTKNALKNWKKILKPPKTIVFRHRKKVLRHQHQMCQIAGGSKTRGRRVPRRPKHVPQLRERLAHAPQPGRARLHLAERTNRLARAAPFGRLQMLRRRGDEAVGKRVGVGPQPLDHSGAWHRRKGSRGWLAAVTQEVAEFVHCHAEALDAAVSILL